MLASAVNALELCAADPEATATLEPDLVQRLIAAARLTNEAPSPCRYVPDLDSRWERAILA